MEIKDSEDYGSVHGRGGDYAAESAGSEVLYLHKLLERMGFAQASPTPVHEDNTECMEWGNNVIGGREQAKHIDIQKHFAHEVIQNGEMLLVCVPTVSQLAVRSRRYLHQGPALPAVAGMR